MSDLINRIHQAQREVGERLVLEDLAASGFSLPIDAARDAAHRALDAAERAWYTYAGQCSVGPDRIAAFEVYERVRLARCK